jgi:hypothetical protein
MTEAPKAGRLMRREEPLIEDRDNTSLRRKERPYVH